MRALLLVMVLAGWAACSAWGQATDPLAAYQIIAARNIFDQARGSAPPPAPPSRESLPPAPEPRDSLTLVGVAILKGKAVAVFAGSSAALAGSRDVGGALDELRIDAIDTSGVTLTATAETQEPIQLAVGCTIARRRGQPWESSTATVPPMSQTGSTPAPASTTATPPAGDGDSILKRLLERRKQELGK